uniref:Protein HTATIP2 n=1 Tax=Heterorhabditis bacteriophora TaxID=37862 RepID=A0A1I7XU98_HETBA
MSVNDGSDFELDADFDFVENEAGMDTSRGCAETFDVKRDNPSDPTWLENITERYIRLQRQVEEIDTMAIQARPYSVCLSQCHSIDVLIPGELYTTEMFISHEEICLPLIAQVQMMRMFNVGSLSKCFRIELDRRLLSCCDFLTIANTPLLKKSHTIAGGFSLRLPCALTDLLCGCPDNDDPANVLRTILPSNCVIEPGTTSVCALLALKQMLLYSTVISVLQKITILFFHDITMFISKQLAFLYLNLNTINQDICRTNMSASKRAFVLGASGAVGRCLVKYLVDSSGFSKIILLGRREIEVPYGGKVEQHVVDFDKIDEYGNILTGCDVGFCALGTTRSKSGAEGFYKVDHDYVVNTAKVAKKNGGS